MTLAESDLPDGMKDRGVEGQLDPVGVGSAQLGRYQQDQAQAL